MRILIADDHVVVRQGLKQILAEEFPAADFGEAGTTQETLQRLAQNPLWDLLVLDVFMPGRSGLEVLADVRLNHTHIPVLVLSSAPEEQLAVRMLKMGARGYLNKETAADHLVLAVRKILSGQSYVSDKVAQRLATKPDLMAQHPHETLSDREFQVLRLVVSGKSLKEIAAELSLSIKTISTFHTRIWHKIGVRNDVELVRYALEHRLTELPVSLNCHCLESVPAL
jgi:two-component system, NarL family, invasion response regulator UvrY